MKSVKSPSYLEWIRQLPCCICGNNIETEAAHIRYGDARFGKRASGMGEKPDDRWTLPLCSKHHRTQHEYGEWQWWKAQKVDPLILSLALQTNALDTSAAEKIINAWND